MCDNSHEFPKESLEGKNETSKCFWDYKYSKESKIKGAEQLVSLKTSVDYMSEIFAKFENETTEKDDMIKNLNMRYYN